MILNMTVKEKNETMAAQVHNLVEHFFDKDNLDDSDEESVDSDDPPLGAQGPAPKKPQPKPARIVGGQRHSSKRKKNSPQASG